MTDDCDQTSDFTRDPGETPQSSDVPWPDRPEDRGRSRSGRPRSDADGAAANRLAPGQLVAGRYRIVAFLGKGGMGEVYRADDLELGQSVALKLLPERVSHDPVLADRVRDEVRLARQITHRNVCRIHDIARLPEEDGGDLFISMEYVDGDDLSTLLKRIGRLPQDKAVDVARQLCAALAAAHAEGVVHRDLKPANIMLDGRGAVRLTDFGIAALTSPAAGPNGAAITGREAAPGTPAYMAPEQYEGREVTARSDIYALGLVLFELLTGRRAWDASTYAELRTMRDASRSVPTLSTTGNADVDPALAALVDRCLESDPDDRPASALAVAAALPGADPLAAALAAGETPSPELIAASGGRGVLTPRVAAALALASAALIAVTLTIAGRFSLLSHTGPPPPPEVMREAAIDAITALGHEIDPEIPERSGWLISTLSSQRVTDAVREGRADWSAFTKGINAPIRYWFRLEPGGFEPRTPANRVWTDYPVRDAPGSMIVQLDQNRMLRAFSLIPSSIDDEPDESEPDWSVAFDLAGLDIEDFSPIDARANPGNDPTVRRAWTGRPPADGIRDDGLRLNVYLAASAGRITDITITTQNDAPEASGTNAEPRHGSTPSEDEMAGPIVDGEEAAGTEKQPALEPRPGAEPESDRGTTAARTQAATARFAQRAAQVLLLGTITIGAGLLAYRNIRFKRGDFRRATRLGITMFLLTAAASILESDVAPISIERLIGPYPTWSSGIGIALIAAACYIAAEPLARSRWPGSLVSWTRLFSGQFRDPMIGRDTLIGVLTGGVLAFLGAASPLVAKAIGQPPATPTAYSLIGTFRGVRHTLGDLCGQVASGLLNAAAVALLVLLSMLLLGLLRIRQLWPAILLVTALIILQQLSQTQLSATDRALTAVANIVLLFVLGRVGLLAAAAALTTSSCLSISAAATPFDGWWTASAATPLVMLALVVALAYRTATAGRSIFGDASKH